MENEKKLCDHENDIDNDIDYTWCEECQDEIAFCHKCGWGACEHVDSSEN